MGHLRRVTPVSRSFGFDRGQPIDRYYIEDFLRQQGGPAGAIRGRVLEIQEPTYAQRFGDGAIVERIDVLDIDPENPEATIVADLADAPELPPGLFDCIICTQTLLLIYDVHSAIGTLHRLLRPGGTALVTVPGISQICRPSGDANWSDYWRFTTKSAKELFEEVFQRLDVTVHAYGNVLTSAAFLYGLAVEDLTPAELDAHDPDYQLIIAVKAIKSIDQSGSEDPHGSPRKA